MTSRPRFPIGLTIAVAIVFAICCGVGEWQLERLAWKNGQLARIAALQHAAPQPIGRVLWHAARSGEDVSFTRVAADCAPAAGNTTRFRITSVNGEWIARALADCALAGDQRYDAIVVDRGFLLASRGSTEPPTGATLPPPAHVVGLLVKQESGPGAGQASPYILVAERESPPPPGVAPAPYADAADNLQYAGAYWITWFGLAGAVACVYAAMLWRRFHPKPSLPR